MTDGATNVNVRLLLRDAMRRELRVPEQAQRHLRVGTDRRAVRNAVDKFLGRLGDASLPKQKQASKNQTQDECTISTWPYSVRLPDS